MCCWNHVVVIDLAHKQDDLVALAVVVQHFIPAFHVFAAQDISYWGIFSVKEGEIAWSWIGDLGLPWSLKQRPDKPPALTKVHKRHWLFKRKTLFLSNLYFVNDGITRTPNYIGQKFAQTFDNWTAQAYSKCRFAFKMLSISERK